MMGRDVARMEEVRSVLKIYMQYKEEEHISLIGETEEDIGS